MRRRGFALIELIFVIVMMSIVMMAMMVVAYVGYKVIVYETSTATSQIEAPRTPGNHDK